MAYRDTKKTKQNKTKKQQQLQLTQKRPIVERTGVKFGPRDKYPMIQGTFDS